MVARSIRADTVFLLKKPEKAPYDSEDITRINAVRSDARPTWFALLGALVFVGITLLGVRDVDFFSLHRTTTPTWPWSAYRCPSSISSSRAPRSSRRHRYISTSIWNCFCNADARFGDDPLSEHIQPWQVAEWGLRRRHLLRKSKGKDARAAPRALAVISSAMSIIFVWVFAPLVISFFWWRSMPTHMGLLTFWLGGLLLLACWVDWWSRAQTMRLLAGKEALPPFFQTMSVVKTLGIALPFWECRRYARQTDSGTRIGQGMLHGVENPTGRQIADYLFDRTSKILLSKELRETKTVEQPKDWLDRAEAERQYRAEWSERENLPFRDLFDAIARF
jgi:hypothetical protein